MGEEYYDADRKDKSEGTQKERWISPMFSLNNRLILEPYLATKTITANVNSGFASISEKEGLIGLKVLVDADINIGSNQTCRGARKGDIAYIRQTYFFTEEGSKKPFSCEAIEGKFIIVNSINVEFIQPK